MYFFKLELEIKNKNKKMVNNNPFLSIIDHRILIPEKHE